MVVAEVPLWVVHSTSASGAEGIASQNASGPIGRANESLSLLENLGSSSSSKAAIYSIDVHPDGTKFATGGGDGAVRIWNSSSLFAKNRGQFKNGTYESSGGESMSEGGGTASSDAGEESAMSDSAPSEAQVHDLNQLVRRKKDGSTPVKNKPPAEANGTMAAPPPPSPQRRLTSSHSHHRLLCTLSAHTGSSVLCVRFSTSGQYLASAGDDAVVCIYAKSNTAAAATGDLEQHHQQEHWTRIKLCRGHTLDVVGLAWAPDDSHLVSCSLDSDAPIIVWKFPNLDQEQYNRSNILANPYKILGKTEHTSTVKGVTFDPAGTYLASSGDDPAVCIWRAHDDWGLEKKISAGIFKQWKEDDVSQLSSQTLFRRLSWSTDGTYICSTNGTVKNKHVASTISREGWSVSSTQSAAAGAANLVGHKQPVVVSRHCPRLIDARKAGDGSNNVDEDEEPDYATLVALGDKRGFVTVWSTRKSRPIFKLQCSESRCTVTDLAWGKVPNGNDLILLVSLLDGNVVALKFGVPNELGSVLSDSMQNRVFQLRYGLDFDDDVGLGRRRMFVGNSSGPKLVENALQIALEEQEEENDDDEVMGNASSSDDDLPISQLGSSRAVKAQQSETHVKGKKRIRPVLMNAESGAPKEKRKMNGDNGKKKRKSSGDPTKDALDSAARAASAAEGISGASPKRTNGTTPGAHAEHATPSRQHGHQHRQTVSPFVTQIGAPQIPHSTSRIHSVELALPPDSPTDMDVDNGDKAAAKIIADCTNTTQAPKGSSGQAISCAVLSISRAGKALWRDEIMGTRCSAIAAAQKVLAVGTADGAVYLYGAPPSLGWSSVMAVRSHPPLIFGQAIVSLQLKESSNSERMEMLVVTSDGSFGVYALIPELKLCYKGSIMPAMTHMILASFGSVDNDTVLPKLARIQITDSNHLLMILSLQNSSSRTEESRHNRSSNTTLSVGVGGGLQGFVYKRSMELWMRVADSRFILSDFYSTLPNKANKTGTNGILHKMENAVKSGSSTSSFKPSHRGGSHSTAMFQNAEGSSGGSIVTRSHCEDRMACAAALGSVDEFKTWFSLYIQALSKGGDVDQLRLLVDMLLDYNDALKNHSWWWLSLAPAVLNVDRKELVRSMVIPEMSKNRALQRVTNEIAMQLDME